MLPALIALLPGVAPAQDAPPVSVEGLPLGGLPKQALPARGCAVYLWGGTATRVFIAMATADPAQLRLSLGGAITDLPRARQQGEGGFGFAQMTEYKAGDVTATLDMTIAQRADLKDGAAVEGATLRLDRAGQDGVVIPVVGLIGCA